MALLRTATSSDLGPVIHTDRVLLRTPQMSDYPDWAELRAASRDFLTPWEPVWAADELTRSSFRRRVRHYLRDLREDMGYALFVFSAESGAGAVNATVNGKMALIGLRITPETVQSGDVEMLEDLIKSAIAAAQRKATDNLKAQMQEVTGGMNLPGLDKMFG